MVKTIVKDRRPDWATRIMKLRKALNLSQGQLAQELQYSAMAVSRWECGLQEPSAECYIKLGKLADEQDRSFFWAQAGLTQADFQIERPSKMAPLDFEIVTAGSGPKRHLAKKAKLVAVPLLKVHVGTPGEEGDHLVDLTRAQPEEVIAPVSWCPNPNSTHCLRVKGKSMTPLIYDGDIVAVDGSQTKHSELNDKIVIAWHKKKGLAVSRFLHIDGIEVLESDNRDYKPVTLLSNDRNWRVVGKVLWLIRQTN